MREEDEEAEKKPSLGQGRKEIKEGKEEGKERTKPKRRKEYL